MKRRDFKKIIVVIVSIILFLLILCNVLISEMTFYDNWAYNLFVEKLRSRNMTNIMTFITFFGSAYALIGTVLLILLINKDKKEGLFGVLNIALIYLINNTIKLIVQRPRPSGYNLVKESNYSFPSGHAMISCAVYGFLIYLIYKYVKEKKIKYLLISLLSLLIITIAISRVYLGVHYLSDTLAGIIFSIGYLTIFITLIDKKGTKNGKKNKTKKTI